MAKKMLTSYDRMYSAEQARNAMLSAGFSAGQMELTSLAEEAGPTRDNFVLEYQNTDAPGERSSPGAIFEGNDTNDRLERQKMVCRGNCLLLVRPDGEAQTRLAADIARRFGALDIK